MVVFYIALVIYIVIGDIVPQILNKEWKMLKISVSVVVISITISMLMIFNIKVIVTVDLIKKAVLLIFGDLVPFLVGD